MRFGTLRLIAAAGIATIALWSARSESNSYALPIRPLTHDELVDHAVGSADGIVVAYLQGFQSIRTPVDGHPGLEHEDHYLVVYPIEWLKGGSKISIIRVAANQMSPLPYDEEKDARTRYVLFLSQWKGNWSLNASPNDYMGGIGRLDDKTL